MAICYEGDALILPHIIKVVKMKKEQVLICDNKGNFLKMFRRNFKEEYDFVEGPLSFEGEKQVFRRTVYVIYEHDDLLNFMQKGKNGADELVCIFNRQFYKSISFLGRVNNLILFDETKTRTQIFKELKAFFRGKLELGSRIEEYESSVEEKRKLPEYCSEMYFLI